MIFEATMFIALWIGLSSLIAAWDTIHKYWPRARMFMKSPDGRDFTGFLIAGVVVVMVGSLFGNAYWQAFWLLDWYGWPGSAFVQDIGLGVNAIFRNGGLLLSAYLFSRAFRIALAGRMEEISSGRSRGTVNSFTIKTLGVGFVISVILIGGSHFL